MSDTSLAKARNTIERYLGRSRPPDESSSDEFLKITTAQLFGDVWNRPGLAWRERCLITVTTLIAQGHIAELKNHMEGARRLGFTLQELEEVCLQLGYYVGFPVAHAAVRVARSVYSDHRDIVENT